MLPRLVVQVCQVCLRLLFNPLLAYLLTLFPSFLSSLASFTFSEFGAWWKARRGRRRRPSCRGRRSYWSSHPAPKLLLHGAENHSSADCCNGSKFFRPVVALKYLFVFSYSFLILFKWPVFIYLWLTNQAKISVHLVKMFLMCKFKWLVTEIDYLNFNTLNDLNNQLSLFHVEITIKNLLTES